MNFMELAYTLKLYSSSGTIMSFHFTDTLAGVVVYSPSTSAFVVDWGHYQDYGRDLMEVDLPCDSYPIDSVDITIDSLRIN